MTLYRRAWTMQLRAGAEDAYDAAHAAVWPELTRQMVADGIHRFHLFRSGLTIFAVQERLHPFPPETAEPSEVSRRWWQAMARLMVTDDRGRPDKTVLKEVFTLDTGTLERDTAE